MKKHFITLTTGESFPVEISLGAMLIFKEETGREATEADMGSLSDLIKLLWAGAAAASETAGIAMNYTPQQFANRLTPEELKKWKETYVESQRNEENPEKGEEVKKKTARDLRAVRVCGRSPGNEPHGLLPAFSRAVLLDKQGAPGRAGEAQPRTVGDYADGGGNHDPAACQEPDNAEEPAAVSLGERDGTR